jgi:hypothetical protein
MKFGIPLSAAVSCQSLRTWKRSYAGSEFASHSVTSCRLNLSKHQKHIHRSTGKRSQYTMALIANSSFKADGFAAA